MFSDRKQKRDEGQGTEKRSVLDCTAEPLVLQELMKPEPGMGTVGGNERETMGSVGEREREQATNRKRDCHMGQAEATVIRFRSC